MSLTPKALLAKARILLEDATHWTKGVAARDKFGRPANADNKQATCWCSIGALRRAVTDETGLVYYEGETIHTYLAALNALAKAIEPKVDPGDATMVIAVTNDAENTKHADVLAIFDKAIALAKGTV